MGKRHPNLPAWQWRTQPQNHQHATNQVLQLLALPLLVIGFLLMVSLAVTAALAALNGWLARYAPSIPLLWSGVSMFVSLVVTTGLFALLFRFLPDVHLRWRDVLTEQDLADYDTAASAAMSPALRTWVENGRLVAGDPATSPD